MKEEELGIYSGENVCQFESIHYILNVNFPIILACRRLECLEQFTIAIFMSFFG